MKYFCLFLCTLLAVVCVSGQGFPTKICPPGEHSVLYCPRTAEPDCTNPSVDDLPEKSGACSIPDCFCNTPTVRDLTTGKCVMVADCPKKPCP